MLRKLMSLLASKQVSHELLRNLPVPWTKNASLLIEMLLLFMR